jgi:hypothetical protein
MAKTFILGLGAQKCGTTWLYKYLSQSRNFTGGLWKEYHVWDVIDIPLLSPQRVTPRFFMKKKKRLRYHMQTQPDTYFKYFDSLLNEDRTITADITPEYSGLGQDALRKIKHGFEELRIRCKAVLLIRDPVERCRSAVRFNLDRSNFEEGISKGNTEFCSALQEYYPSEHARIRTRYDMTIENMKAVFGPDEYYVGVYESMFQEDNLARLSDFLGVQKKAEFARTEVNKTRGYRESCGEVAIDIRDYYSDVYQFCFEEIPETRELWVEPESRRCK